MRTMTDGEIDGDLPISSEPSIGGNRLGAFSSATENDPRLLTASSASSASWGWGWGWSWGWGWGWPSTPPLSPRPRQPPSPSPPSDAEILDPRPESRPVTIPSCAGTTPTSGTTAASRLVSPPKPPPLWREFQRQNHSLVVYASDVAACAGYHDFKSCPELMMRHCYQGRGGDALRRHDAALLGLTVTSSVDDDDEERLLELAGRAGPLTVGAVREALKVKHGERRLDTVGSADQVRREVIHHAAASERLSRHELDVLLEGTRKAVDTGCGRSWEDEALDRYGARCGWEVRERNAECRVWHFRADPPPPEDADGRRTDGPSPPSAAKTATLHAVGPAYARPARGGRDPGRGTKRKMAAEPEATTASGEAASVPEAGDALLVDLTADDDEEGGDSDGEDLATKGGAANEPAPPTGDGRPYYLIIRGMVDGVRDELAPGRAGGDDGGDDDDDNWVLRRVVVECKHRMRALLPYPRLYECIQAVVYCLMYGAEDADIIQVLRTGGDGDASRRKGKREGGKEGRNHRPHRREFEITRPSPQARTDNNETKKDVLLTDHFGPANATARPIVGEVVGDGGTEDEPGPGTADGATVTAAAAEAVPSSCPRRPTGTEMEIAVSRVSLWDEHRHLSNWDAEILPNLRRWADAVYRIRASDEKRYRLLCAVAKAQAATDDPARQREHMGVAWRTVLHECPFLREGCSGGVYRRETQCVSP